ncbi:DNA primase regulatory subunit PriL [Stygiolobus caldivivus]|uniref:DNA primase regulatory subunit PriL n=1 Tax=Stygiolobus caldivivus TaxID=2824673 RepID=UPI001C84E433|nr:DNA primase regulatory subunit PriL [Stygiolobus caldivivus]
MALIDYSKYPFLKSLEDELSKYGSSVTIKDLLSTSKEKLMEARTRIENVIRDKQNLPYSKLHGDTVLVFYLSILILSALGSKIITEKFIESEVNLFKQELKFEQPSVVIEIGKILGININNEEGLELREIQNGKKIKIIRLPYSIPFLDYLKYTIELRKKDDRYSLRKHILSKGNVYIDKEELIDLVVERIKDRMSSIVKQTQLTDLPDEIKKMADNIRGRKTPPCMLELMKKKDNLSDEEKKIIITYLIDIGSEVEGFTDEYKKLRNNKYIVYSCQKLKEKGLCVNECGVINPLQLYYGKLL